MNPRQVEARVENPSDAGIRLDVFLSERLKLFSRSQARWRIQGVTVNGVPGRLGRKVRLGDLIAVTYTDPPLPELAPEDIRLAVIFENDDVIVINKPQGMVVHPGSGNPSGTLLNALLFHCQNLARGFGPDNPRPGIVHRLDKDTSGVMIVAKNVRAHEHLAGQFKERGVRKRYLAVVNGRLPSAAGTIETRLARDARDRRQFTVVAAGGRIAVTKYRTLRTFEVEQSGYALVLLAPRTGRTHQLRVHLRHLGCPILGDPLYGRPDPRFPGATLMLHARSLCIKLPGEEQPRTFLAPMPERFRPVLHELQSFSPRKGL